MYITQAFLHALIAALVADRVLTIWKIEVPRVKQRFSLIAVVFPVVSFPVYQLLDPERGTVTFRIHALFDSSAWLNIVFFDMISLGTVFLFFLAIAVLIFVFQELIPVILHLIETRRTGMDDEIPADSEKITEALEKLSAGKTDVYIVDEEPVLFSKTGKRPAIFISESLVENLDREHLEAAFAHELAHIQRGRVPLLTIMFLFRMVMFFNPVALLEFRRATLEEEKICDDIAVRITGKPEALADTLKQFYPMHLMHDVTVAMDEKEGEVEKGRSLVMENRIRRLEKGYHEKQESGWTAFAVTMMVVFTINYFVV